MLIELYADIWSSFVFSPVAKATFTPVSADFKLWECVRKIAEENTRRELTAPRLAKVRYSKQLRANWLIETCTAAKQEKKKT